MPNTAVPPIPAPLENVRALAYCTLALKQAIDSLAGRLRPGDQAVTVSTLPAAVAATQTNQPALWEAASFAVASGTALYLCDPTANAITATLPPTPAVGDTYTVKDATGQAAAHNITIAGNGHNIEGNATLVLNANYGKAKLAFSGAQWVQL